MMEDKLGICFRDGMFWCYHVSLSQRGHLWAYEETWSRPGSLGWPDHFEFRWLEGTRARSWCQSVGLSLTLMMGPWADLNI